MKKKTKKTKTLNDLHNYLHNRIHSHDFRKMALLSFVVITLFFDLSIMHMGKMLSKEYQKKSPEQISNPWEKNVRALVEGTPMEKMIPYISGKDKKTAAFLVGIAKKESNWGKRSPKLNGKDCYNYWGYRDQSGLVTPGGYTCFSSPRQAVNVVSGRMNDLIYDSKLDTPKKMAVWKCGYDCSWDNPVAVKKWVSDVDFYFQKFYE